MENPSENVKAGVVPNGDVPLQSNAMLPEEPDAGVPLAVSVEQFAVKVTVATAGKVCAKIVAPYTVTIVDTSRSVTGAMYFLAIFNLLVSPQSNNS